MRTYRFRAHSMFDPELYRDKAEVAEWRKRDPIELLATRMKQDDELTDSDREAMRAQVEAEIDQAAQAAEGAPLEPVEELTRFVYTEGTGGVR